MEAGVAANEYAGSGAAGADSVRVQPGAVHAAAAATGALGGDADAAGRNVGGVARGEDARARRRAGAGTVAECRSAVGARGAAAIVRVRRTGEAARVKATCAGEDADVATARDRCTRYRGAVQRADAARSRSAFPRTASAAVDGSLVPVPDQVRARGRARAVRTECADAMGAAG